MAKTKEVSLNASVSSAINGKHDLDRFKKGKNPLKNNNFASLN